MARPPTFYESMDGFCMFLTFFFQKGGRSAAKAAKKSAKMQGYEQFVTFKTRKEKIKKGLEKGSEIGYNVILDNEGAHATHGRGRKDIV